MSKIKMFNLLIALMITLNSCDSSPKRRVNSTPVSQFNLDDYLGKWYEIARLPNKFEKNLVGVTATYSLRKNGKITVINAGHRGSLDGKLKTAVGKAKIPDPSRPGHLKVSFFLWFYADYNILYLSADCQYALVGSSGPSYLWILSRTANPDPAIIHSLKMKAHQRGYAISKMLTVPQKNATGK